MTRRSLAALPAPLAFAALAAALAASGAVDPTTAVQATVAAALVVAVQVLGGGSGWRGRVGEILLFPAGLALFLVADGERRTMVLRMLLAAAALAAGAVSVSTAGGWRRRGCAAVLALALLVVAPPPAEVPLAWRLAVVAAAVAAAASSVRRAGLLLAALAPVLAVSVAPPVTVGGLVLAAVVLSLPGADAVTSRLVPLGAAISLAAAAVGTWGLRAPAPLFPGGSPLLFAAAALVIVAAPRVPPALVGALWCTATLALGPIQPVPTGQHVVLTAATPRAELEIPRQGTAVLETSLAHASELVDGTLVAVVQAGGASVPIRAGEEAVEWAYRREDVRRVVRHGLPGVVVWQPHRGSGEALWGVAGQLRLPIALPSKVAVERAAGLPAAVHVTVRAAVHSSPFVPLLLGSAVAVALLQLVSGSWKTGAALLPWVVLTGASLLARTAVSPVAGTLHHHAADVALAAVLAAWLPAARCWLPQRRETLAAATLLVPLAVATPVLTPPLYGDEPYHLAILEALSRGASLSQAVIAGAPPGHTPLHGPFLALALLPGYLVAGRTGALVQLALLAAVAVGLVARRARTLGVPPPRVGLMVTMVLVTTPLATYATQIWPEVVGMLAVAVGLLLASGGAAARVLTVPVALLAAAVKTRLAVFTFPLAAAALWPVRGRRRQAVVGLTALVAAAFLALGVAWLFLGYPLGAPRSFRSLLAIEPRRALLAVGGLLFDPAGGLALAAPLTLVAVLGLPRLVRRGSGGEVGVMVGLALTVLALLHSVEWYGGGAPPARYLAAGLPPLWIAGALLLRRPPPGVAAAPALLPLALAWWWALLTRPHFSINPGNGRFWLGELLAERLAADTRHLTPSFLVPSAATVVFPLAAATIAATVWGVSRLRPSWVRWLGRQGVAVWLLVMAAAALHLAWRSDREVELEDPQVRHLGGRVEPPAGTWSTYLHPRGWRVAEGDGLLVPLRLPERGKVSLVGWLEGAARQGAVLEVAWNDGQRADVPVAGEGVGKVALPAPPSAGRHTLMVRFHAPAGGEAILDRLEVRR